MKNLHLAYLMSEVARHNLLVSEYVGDLRYYRSRYDKEPDMMAETPFNWVNLQFATNRLEKARKIATGLTNALRCAKVHNWLHARAIELSLGEPVLDGHWSTTDGYIKVRGGYVSYVTWNSLTDEQRFNLMADKTAKGQPNNIAQSRWWQMDIKW